jgi:hypothetical protein
MYPDERAEEWRNEILAIESEAVRLALEAAQEHLACACGGIEGHLRVRGLSAEAATEHRATLDGLARMIDGDDGGNDVGHNVQTDDPGDGSGPAFCICGRWNDGEGITYGQHIADEYARLHEGDSR